MTTKKAIAKMVESLRNANLNYGTIVDGKAYIDILLREVTRRKYSVHEINQAAERMAVELSDFPEAKTALDYIGAEHVKNQTYKPEAWLLRQQAAESATNYDSPVAKKHMEEIRRKYGIAEYEKQGGR